MGVLLPIGKKWKQPMRTPAAEYRHSPAKDEYHGLVQHRDEQPHFGRYGLQVLEEGWVTSRQIEVLRRALVTAMERRGKVYIRAFPHQVITQRIAETRIGVSRGNFEYWVAAVKANYVLLEIDGVSEEVAFSAFRKASRELPIKCRMVKKEHLPEEFELDYQHKPRPGWQDRQRKRPGGRYGRDQSKDWTEYDREDRYFEGEPERYHGDGFANTDA
uniref:Ribosomal protein L10e/L16 domain-containing protein n=1 Tax=Alexandrium catenella TaxID=2925 RepID=A0A7S1LBU3_ALECA